MIAIFVVLFEIAIGTSILTFKSYDPVSMFAAGMSFAFAIAITSVEISDRWRNS